MSRKSFNLSLQKKRNEIVLNPIIEKCEEDGSYIADKVVDYVEKALIYERSIGLSKVLNTYGLIKNTLSSQYPEDSEEYTRRVEDVLRSVISIDGERLAQFISDPHRYSDEASDMQASANRSPIEKKSPTETPTPSSKEVVQNKPTIVPDVIEEEEEVMERESQQEVEAERKRKKKEEEEKKKQEQALEERRKKREEQRKKREAEQKEAQRKEKEKEVEATSVESDDDDESIELNVSALFND